MKKISISHRNQNSKLTLKIPQSRSWDCPEGTHPGEVDAVFRIAKNGQTSSIRMIFSVSPDLKHPGRAYSVGRNFEPCLEYNCDLRQAVINLLGRDFTHEELEHGDFDLESLVGKQATLTIQHYTNETHAKPFVFVAEIHPLTTTQ